jgi:CubicO group peptidase (beta-lactamase class C family)
MLANSVDHAALDQAIQDQMQKHAIPGVAVAIIENGKPTYLRGFGNAGERSITPQTPMLIGSQSKSITALAIMQLAEQGKLELDTPITQYLPWFRVADESASEKITINHLLHHTSGLSDAGYGVILPVDTDMETAIRSLEKARQTAPEGTAFQYFNMGYVVLAHIVEIASGQSYADYIHDNIFEPLGMDQTTADPEKMFDLSNGYTRIFGFPVQVSESIPVYEIGAGFILSNAEDMAKFASAMLGDGGGVISEKMKGEILIPSLGGYAAGWMIADGGGKIHHGGANNTFHTEVNLYPYRDKAFVVLMNVGSQEDHFISTKQLTDSIEAVVLGNSPPSIDNGMSVRWFGWVIGALVAGLIILHTRNFYDLFHNWRNRFPTLPPFKKVADVALSFIIPTAILILVYSQVKSFYGNRFNLATNLFYMGTGLPDVLILMVVGIIPDYIQGFTKLGWVLMNRNPEKRARLFGDGK